MIDKYFLQSQETFAELFRNKDVFSILEYFVELGIDLMNITLQH